MLRSLIAALVVVLAGGLFLPAAPIEAGQRMSIQTKVGVQNPHKQQNAQFRWWQCYGCHVANNISARQVKPGGPMEPCMSCHLPATPAEVQFTRSCQGRGCPVMLNYRQPDGSTLTFYFGDMP